LAGWTNLRRHPQGRGGSRVRRPGVQSLLLTLGLGVLWLLGSGGAWAGPLVDRMAAFPDWRSPPSLAIAVDDLYYPRWFLGEWQVVTTLTDLAAPLAPKVVTPGYDRNRDYLEQPIAFRARFVETRPPSLFQGLVRSRTELGKEEPRIIADRAFNGRSLIQAYLGETAVQAVTQDPDTPNRQVIQLRPGQQLISTVTARGTETPDPHAFVTSELVQQEFRRGGQLYLNDVETTTIYRQAEGQAAPGEAGSQPLITADQVTAVYLSPQDPDYFKTLAGLGQRRPVALYRYRLDFFPP
jgi:hypothetical protein